MDFVKILFNYFNIDSIAVFPSSLLLPFSLILHLNNQNHQFISHLLSSLYSIVLFHLPYSPRVQYEVQNDLGNIEIKVKIFESTTKRHF